MPAPAEFEERYRQAFAGLRVGLLPGDACSVDELCVVERSIGITLPASLRSYFRVAGRESRLNQAHNHLLSPEEWFVDSTHLVFLAENQNVVFWGVRLDAVEHDPPVFQGVNGDRIEWYPEHFSCAEFLCVMLHWQVVMGAFGRTWSAVVGSDFPTKLDSWTPVGKANGMHAFARDGIALCWLRWDEDWRIFVAGSDHAQVEQLGDSLSIAWDRDYE